MLPVISPAAFPMAVPSGPPASPPMVPPREASVSIRSSACRFSLKENLPASY